MSNAIVVTNLGGTVQRIICSALQAQEHLSACEGQIASAVSWTIEDSLSPNTLLELSPGLLERVEETERRFAVQLRRLKLMDKHCIANDRELRVSILNVIEEDQTGG